MFAPAHHPATRHVVPVRKALGVRTIFNFLGPLTNPAGASRQLIGVSDPAYLELIAGALRELGCERALVVSSDDGLDEVSVAGETQRGRGDARRRHRAHVVAPEQVGLERAALEAVAGGDARARTPRSPARSSAASRAAPDAGRDQCRRRAVRRRSGDELRGRRALAEQAIDSGAARGRPGALRATTNALALREAAV